MALPENISTPTELKQLLQHYAENHTGITEFVFGKYQQLAEALKKLKDGEYILFCPYPSVLPRDNSGAMDFRFSANLALCTPNKKDKYSDELAALSAALPISEAILKRLRKDAADRSWSFTINQTTQLDPLLDYSLDNAVGYQFPIYIGDFQTPLVNEAIWADL